MGSPARSNERINRGPLPPALRLALGVPLSLLYGLEIARRNRAYDGGRGVVTFDRPVISVGNLSAGGTGKTPMVQWLAGKLIAAGRRPCIAMRGYGGGGGNSDEAEEYRRLFPDLAVVAQPNRIHGLLRLFHGEYEAGGPHSDCILLDDGFQHRRIARDADVVLIDAVRSPFADRLLPAGWLREGPASLKRATHVVITHAESVAPADLADLERRIERTRGTPPEAVTRHAWAERAMVLRPGRGPVEEDISVLRGRRVVAVCAIGNPGPFVRAVEKAGGEGGAGGSLVAALTLRDHDPYKAPTVRRVLELARGARGVEGVGGAEFIVTTEKDWSKLAAVPAAVWPCPVVVPRLRLMFDRGEAGLAAAMVLAAERGIETGEEAGAV